MVARIKRKENLPWSCDCQAFSICWGKAGSKTWREMKVGRVSTRTQKRVCSLMRNLMFLNKLLLLSCNVLSLHPFTRNKYYLRTTFILHIFMQYNKIKKRKVLVNHGFQGNSWDFSKTTLPFNPLATSTPQSNALLLPWKCRIYEFIRKAGRKGQRAPNFHSKQLLSAAFSTTQWKPHILNLLIISHLNSFSDNALVTGYLLLLWL